MTPPSPARNWFRAAAVGWSAFFGGIVDVIIIRIMDLIMAIADRIGVMSHGKLEQLGSAEDLYKRPASRFVALPVPLWSACPPPPRRSATPPSRHGKADATQTGVATTVDGYDARTTLQP